MIKAVAHAVAHAEVLELCLREQLVTHAGHFKFQSLILLVSIFNVSLLLIPATVHLRPRDHQHSSVCSDGPELLPHDD